MLFRSKVANRAEFDRMHALFIEAHEQAKQPCSLIMVDIDHFKRINDTFGHQAGDEAIISMANLLSSECRAGDLVARYGGEEFVVLMPDTNQAQAQEVAERVRQAVSDKEFGVAPDRSILTFQGSFERSWAVEVAAAKAMMVAEQTARRNGKSCILQFSLTALIRLWSGAYRGLGGSSSSFFRRPSFFSGLRRWT